MKCKYNWVRTSGAIEERERRDTHWMSKDSSTQVNIKV